MLTAHRTPMGLMKRIERSGLRNRGSATGPVLFCITHDSVLRDVDTQPLLPLLRPM